ncbi:hypothetical protein BKA63DRAFT_553962 [Paraphoma chrysanthemicola]|nr:hypothetical protein BKA63DRAFT_553962 [Paraphoma chrysanthemicola]
MRVSYSFLLAISSALAIPIPSTYTWSITQFSGGWFHAGYANLDIGAPQATISGITVPALSLTGICYVVAPINGPIQQDCTSRIADNTDGRSLEFTVRPFDNNVKEVQLDGVYSFTSNGKKYAVDAYLSKGTNEGTVSKTIVPSNLREV